MSRYIPISTFGIYRPARSPHDWRAVDRRSRITGEETSYRIDIRNSGLPIPAEHLNCIFEEYTSYAGGCDRSSGGLGLAICRMIVTQHEGKIWAENTAIGP